MIRTKTLGDRIAAAIKRTDTTYFWEDYSKQADAVLRAIAAEGYVLVHKEPSREMLDAGLAALKYGRVKKYEVLREAYVSMIEASLRSRD